MKKSIATIAARAILGLFALGMGLGFFAGCADVLNGPPAGLTEGGPAGGTGRVLIRLGPKAEGARTLMPAAADYDALSYTYTFTSEGKDPVSGALTEGTAAADLEAGTWTLTVEGKGGEEALILKGTVTGIEVSAGTSTDVSVNMKGYTEAGAGDGTLGYTVTFPAAVSVGTLTVYGWDSDEKQGTPVDLAEEDDTDDDDDTKTVTGTITVPGGIYRVALDLYKADGVLSRTDLAHIYPDLTTEAPYTVAAGDFVPATVDSAQTSLAGVLGSVSSLTSGADVTYVLPSGNETMSATSVSNTNGSVTVTIDGGGREVTLDNSDGSLITVGDKVTLVLKNITLKGRGEDYDNSAALVSVESGGTLETGTGVLITANQRNGGNGGNGGGVYVNGGGTLVMNGGEIAGNTSYSSSSSYGGGVYIDSGTFTMNGGEIAGNNSYSYSAASSSYGGGVYVGSGTFTMNGGEIAGNTSYSYSSSSYSSSCGGGVYVGSGTFTINGGEIAGNTSHSSSSSSYGGGVYVGDNGTFTMSGGEIAGNTARFYGGGVYVGDNGTFTMSGGEIAGNTASTTTSSSGGGVYVGDNGTFTMNGGEIAGNTASSSGGGVFVSGGTFTKSGGGTIYGDTDTTHTAGSTENTAQSGNGHAVYVAHSSAKIRNITVGPDADLDSAQSGAAGGWVDPPIPSTVTGITYDDVWALQEDGRRKSPAINHNGVTKARVSFTAAANALITIQLDVSSESGYDYAFISTLDNGSATYNGGYYTDSRISGTYSVTVTIPVPTAGSHFVDICYRKDGSRSFGSDCAWFKVVE